VTHPDSSFFPKILPIPSNDTSDSMHMTLNLAVLTVGSAFIFAPLNRGVLPSVRTSSDFLTTSALFTSPPTLSTTSRRILLRNIVGGTLTHQLIYPSVANADRTDLQVRVCVRVWVSSWARFNQLTFSSFCTFLRTAWTQKISCAPGWIPLQWEFPVRPANLVLKLVSISGTALRSCMTRGVKRSLQKF